VPDGRFDADFVLYRLGGTRLGFLSAPAEDRMADRLDSARHRSGPGTAGTVRQFGYGYGTGVRQSEVGSADGVHGFPTVLSSFVGRDDPVREVAGLLERRRLVTAGRHGQESAGRRGGPTGTPTGAGEWSGRFRVRSWHRDQVLHAATDPEVDVLLAAHGPVGAIARRAESAIRALRTVMAVQQGVTHRVGGG